MDYKSAGVDVEAGEELVDWLKSSEASRKDSRVISGIGGFASVFRASFPSLKKPCLVSSTDGVGTKLLWGIEAGRYQGLGQDVVAMCVNDLVCVGADPLFFLDYFACGKLDQGQAQEFLKGVKAACEESNCTLIGGETAEMPGMYAAGHFDCAGFSVGVVDEDEMWGSHQVLPGDRLVGIKSSGFHSNGYSLLRKIFASDWREREVELLAPTKLYVRLTQSLREEGVKIHAAAHITGGGIQNLARVLPPKTTARVQNWRVPDLFLEAKERAALSWQELLDTFNCGVGLIFVLPAEEAEKILKAHPTEALALGHVENGSKEEPSIELEGWN